MPDITITYKNEKALHALQDLSRYLDFVVKKPVSAKKTREKNAGSLPITFAEDPDVTALAGIWKGKDISLNDLRKNACGKRI